MGRRKISIAPIADDRNRSVTFLKRKNGLFKKAYELGILCSAEVAVVVFSSAGKLFEWVLSAKSWEARGGGGPSESRRLAS